jgi:hypothetical protein
VYGSTSAVGRRATQGDVRIVAVVRCFCATIRPTANTVGYARRHCPLQALTISRCAVD